MNPPTTNSSDIAAIIEYFNPEPSLDGVLSGTYVGISSGSSITGSSFWVDVAPLLDDAAPPPLPAAAEGAPAAAPLLDESLSELSFPPTTTSPLLEPPPDELPLEPLSESSSVVSEGQLDPTQTVVLTEDSPSHEAEIT